LHLQTQPKLSINIESFGNAQGHVGRNSSPPIQHTRKCWSRYPKMTCNLSHRLVLQVISQNPSRMCGIVHLHCLNSTSHFCTGPYAVGFSSVLGSTLKSHNVALI